MTDMTDNKDESRLDSNQHSNLYTDAEWNQIKHAVERYTRIKSDLQRHRTEWLKIVGPALVMVRDKAIEVAGTTKTNSQTYRDAIGEELKRTRLETIDKSTRSYLLKIMDNLEEVQAWLAERTNTDRLNHPKTIWKAFQEQFEDEEWCDDPGVDPEDDEEYWKAWVREKTHCQCCGRETAFVVSRKDGSWFCDDCHKANPEKDDDDAGDGACGDDDKGDDAGGDDHDKDKDKDQRCARDK
jgi:hypothetical protein